MIEWIWVILPDGGCEGLGCPLQAFASEELARLALKQMNAMAHTSLVVYKIPMYPNCDIDAYARPVEFPL